MVMDRDSNWLDSLLAENAWFSGLVMVALVIAAIVLAIVE